jgi:urease accessory protein
MEDRTMTATARRASLTWHALLASAPALAHHPMAGTTPETFSHGLLSGLGHPILGLDHFAVLIGAGGPRRPLRRGGLAGPGLCRGDGGGRARPYGGIRIAGRRGVGGRERRRGRRCGGAAPDAALGLAATLFAGAGLVHGHALAEAIIGAETTPLLAFLLGLVAIQTALAGGVLLLARWLPRAR